MDQATLDDRIWPEYFEDPDHLSVSIYGETAWLQAFAYHRLEERAQLRCGVFSDIKLSSYQRVSLTVHQDNDAVRAVKECSVKKKVLSRLRLQSRCGGRICEEAVDQAVQPGATVSALEGELAHRVPLNYPPSEPFHLLRAPHRGVAPTERVSTTAAKPPLTTADVMAISLGHTPATRAVFFGDITT